MQDYAPDRVRNVALLGHSKAGKTTLAEAMLLASGAITRLGRVEDGSTVSDFDDEEHSHGFSIATSLLTIEWRGHRLHLLDTPGYADFEGEVVSAVAAADIGLIAVDAVSGIEGGTDAAWEHLERGNVASRLFAITRTDRENADVAGVLAALRQRYGTRVVPIAMPGADAAYRSLLDGPAEDPALDEARETLVEALAETDDGLLERYLEGEDLAQPELMDALCRAARAGEVYPVLPVCALQARGVPELLSALCDLGAAPAVTSQGGPALVQVVKTTSDPFVGHLSYVRVLRGTLTHGEHLRNQRNQADERAAHLFLMRGKEQIEVPALAAGDVGAIPRLSHTATGDLLAAGALVDGEAASIPALNFPTPTYRSALRPRSRDDMDRVSQALAKVMEQDPTIALDREAGTGEMVLLTVGDVQAGIVASRLQREYGVAVDVAEPMVPYCETIRGSVQTEYRHKKQTGGRGQFGHVVIRVEPLPRGAGFEFVDEVTGGRVPRQYIPAVEQGIVEALAEGPLTRSRLVDLRVTLLDGSVHSVDSSEYAFKIAAAQALHQAVLEAQPILLEPVMRLFVEVPSDLTGDIANELNGRRGSVLGFDAGERVTTVEALAPLAEVQRLAPQLRSVTHGRGRFRLEFDHLADVPPQVQERVLAERQPAAAR